MKEMCFIVGKERQGKERAEKLGP